MRHYEFIEHTADIAIRAYGDTLEDAFAEAAQGMFDIITDSATVESVTPFEFTIEAMDREALLVSFLSRLIATHEIERIVLGHFDVRFADANSLRVTAWAVPFDAHHYGRGTQVKGVSYHMLELREPTAGAEAMVQVLFDI